MNTTEESYTELIFLFSVQNGFTSRLRGQLVHPENYEIDASSAARKAYLSVEGPYGSHLHAWNSETALFIIGGASITVATPFMQELIDLVQSGEHIDQKVKWFKIVWAVKSSAFYQFVYDRYMATWEAVFASTDIDLSLDVYLTVPYKTDSDDKSSVPEHRTETSENAKKMSTVIFPSSSLDPHVSIENAPSPRRFLPIRTLQPPNNLRARKADN